MTEIESKTCPLCCEEIKAAAKKCPHCGHWQTKWHTTVYHPAFSAIVVGVPLLAIWIAAGVWIERLMRPKDPALFVDHSHEIVVLKSDMHFEENEKGRKITAVGVIQNNGVLAWEDVLIEVQYFDTSGALIDTANDSTRFDVILPGQEAAFRIRADADRAGSDYHEHKVFVRSAAPPGRW